MAARFKDYYQIMGLARDAGAEDIKRAYRKLARKYHPDVSKEKNAEERFKEIGEAYEVLKDPEKRAAYDQLGSNWAAGEDFTPPPGWGAGPRPGGSAHFGGADQFSDFFETLFGFQRRAGTAGAARRGQDQQVTVELTLEEAFSGTTRMLDLTSPEYGSDGAARSKRRSLQVKIPAGVRPGQQVRLAGQGAPGAGQNGDLYLHIEIAPHRWFQLEDRDVYLTLPITPWEAALGTRLVAPTLAGKVDLRIPPQAQSGQKLRLRGRGFPGDPPGDQYVVLQMVNPPVTESNRAAYEALAQALPFNPRAALGV